MKEVGCEFDRLGARVLYGPRADRPTISRIHGERIAQAQGVTVDQGIETFHEQLIAIATVVAGALALGAGVAVLLSRR